MNDEEAANKALVAKIAAMQSKLLVGGKSIDQHTEEQAVKLAARQLKIDQEASVLTLAPLRQAVLWIGACLSWPRPPHPAPPHSIKPNLAYLSHPCRGVVPCT